MSWSIGRSCRSWLAFFDICMSALCLEIVVWHILEVVWGGMLVCVIICERRFRWLFIVWRGRCVVQVDCVVIQILGLRSGCVLMFLRPVLYLWRIVEERAHCAKMYEILQ
jgi:hypothetical protein